MIKLLILELIKFAFCFTLAIAVSYFISIKYVTFEFALIFIIALMWIDINQRIGEARGN